MDEYLIVIEEGVGNFSAYCPDLPGCVAAAETIEEVQALMREAIELHLRGLAEDGLPLPAPSSRALFIRA